MKFPFVAKINIAAIILLLLTTTEAKAAGECVESDYYNIYDGVVPTASVLVLKCTHHTDNSLNDELSEDIMKKLAGKYTYNIVSFPGSPAPTDGTDLSIVDSDGLSLLGLANNGANFIDATTTRKTYFYNTHLSTNEYDIPAVQEAWTISTDENLVASSVFYLRIKMVRQ